MLTLRLMAALTWGLGVVAAVDVMVGELRMDRALVALVCILCGSVLYALEPLFVKWLIEKPLEAERTETKL